MGETGFDRSSHEGEDEAWLEKTKVLTWALQSQTQPALAPQQVSFLALGFSSWTAPSVASEGGGRRFSTPMPTFGGSADNQVCLQESACSCHAHIKGMWPSVGVQGERVLFLAQVLTYRDTKPPTISVAPSLKWGQI